ncbi:MAG: DUF839 domain-containing protein [Roseibacillus sp. TMED18]|nr:MAG: DUF839 domain-containing protein [Roseibacillus sp. TMED18]
MLTKKLTWCAGFTLLSALCSSASADSISKSPSALASVHIGGPDNSASTEYYGSGNDDGFAEYGVASFTFTKDDFGLAPDETIQGINGMTLTLTHNNRSFSDGSELQFWLTTDTFGGDFSALDYDADLINGLNASEYTNAPVSLGIFPYSTQASGTDDFVLEIADLEDELIAVFEAGAEFNIILTAVTADADITFSGLDNTFSPGDPSLAVDLVGAVDRNPPGISSLSPEDDSTDVPINRGLSIRFDEDIALGTGNISIKMASDDSVVEVIDITSSAVQANDSGLSIELSANLPGGADIYVEIDAGAIADLQGNEFAGIADNSTWNFLTSPIPFVLQSDSIFTLDSATTGAELGDIDVIAAGAGAPDENLTYSLEVAATGSSMVFGRGGFSVEPIHTVGETIGDYTPPGILDGLGAFELDASTVRVLANHELLHFRGYPYEITFGTSGSFTMTGARVSYFDIDKNSRQIVASGLAYNTIYNADGVFATDRGFLAHNLAGFSRLCSSQLVEKHQFGNGRGLENTIYFTGEEDGGFYNPVGGAVWALDIETGHFWHVPALGRGAWENVTEIDTGSQTHVAIILADDSSPFDFDPDADDGSEAAPVYLYLGEKNPNGDFLERNGLRGGKLCVWKSNTGELTPLDFRGSGTLNGSWVEVSNITNLAEADESGANGFDEFGYPTQGNLWLQAKGANAFGFSRPEDVSTNPRDGTEVIFASTGVDTFAVDEATGNGADTFGTLYTIKTDFTGVDFGNFPGSSTPTASVTILYDGDADPDRALRNPDNLDWADDGFIYVQEDEAEEDTLSGDEVLFGPGAANSNEASIVKVNPADGSVTTVAEIDRSILLDPTTDGEPVDTDVDRAGEWETSGILDVSTLFGEPAGTLFLFDVQAHGIEDQDNFNPGSRITDGDLVEGGQLSFLSVGGPTSPFAIDPATGVISVADQALLDEEISSMTLLITASDGTNATSFPVTVVIENDLLPEVTASGPFGIPETSQAGRVVGKVDASDANNDVTFSIEGNTNFGIDSATGVITFGGGGPVYTLRNSDPEPYGLVELSTFSHSSNFDSGASEISAFDPVTNKLFVVNGEAGGLDVLDLSDPSNPTKIGDTLTVGGGEVTSASVFGDIVGVTSSLGDGVNGTISFFRTTDLSQLGSTLEVGPTPDMVTFAPDGSKILIAHEGEPDYEAGLDPEGSIGIFAPTGGVSPDSVAALTADDLTIATFNTFDDQKEALQGAGVRIFGDPDENEGFTEADTTVSEDLEPEFITIAADSSTAWITLQENNALAILDLASDTITDVVPLGTKDHSVPGQGLDGSDRDDAIHIIPHPVKGMYMPDTIANYEAGGQTYLVLANEGDDRGEDERIEDLDLDPDAFPQAEALQTDEEAGRLKVSKLDGDTDGDGDFDELFSFGSRSFSIRDTDGNLVFDSGDIIEQLTATLIPLNFNSDNDDPEFDGKSDSQGPEPEGIAVGAVFGNSTLAFVGLEDVGGVLVFDITDPLNVQFQSYLNDRDFGANSRDDYEGSNTAPEGLTFISAADSPNGKALLVVSYEVTGTTGIYEIATLDRPDLGSAGSVVTLDVKVSDGANVIDVPVEITIGTDQPPVVEASGPFTVSDQAPVGTAVGNVDFNDGNGGASDFGLTYSLYLASSLFTVDPVNGVIKVLDMSSLAIGDSVEVTVVAEDGAGQTQATVTIDVINAAPDLDLDDVVSTGDGLPNGTVVVDLDATDGSGGDADQNVVYSLLDEDGPFAIDASSGIITIADNSQLDSADSSVTVSVQITDEFGATTVVDVEVELRMEEGIPAPIADLRVANFNASLNRASAGALIDDLSTPDNAQAKSMAEIIQLANADVILINEFDYDADGKALENFLVNYLEVSQNGLDPVSYPYSYNAPSNTGIPSGMDFDNDGSVGGPGDAYGFGFHEGQFGMVLLSKYPIAENEVRTFQTFLWKDMPGALLPPDPSDTDGDADLSSYYSDDELDVFRLSSKSHWDVPVSVNGTIVHILASHPTPPVFDDGTETDLENPSFADWNGLRNHDEIRFWGDYVDPLASDYIYDDNGNTGGLARGARFVIVGDQNADPVDGDSSFNPIDNVLSSPFVDTTFTPASMGGADFVLENAPGSSAPETKTSSFNLRTDYVLPSVVGLEIEDGATFWPPADDLRADQVTDTDHRLIYLDLNITGLGKAGNSFAHGTFDESAAEIVTFCSITDRFFVSNAEFGTVDVLDGSDPDNLVHIASIPVGEVNHVRAKNGILAAAVGNDDKQLPGTVQFFDTAALNKLSQVEVGVLPDMLIFTPDGKTIITANEGEPNDDYTVDPLGSVSFVDLGSGSLLDIIQVTDYNVITVDFSLFSASPFLDELFKSAFRAEGGRFFGQIHDENGEFVRESTFAEDIEPEYIAVSPDGQEAFVVCQENNLIAVFDIPSRSFHRAFGLGVKDHSIEGNGIDASNRDDGTDIRTWPVFGYYMPDAIDAFEVNGQTFLITANEGDSRDYDGYSEEERVGDLDLDPTVFPHAEELQDDANLGRLKTTIANGDLDGDGDFDQIFSYGARSFTIWDTNGNIVYDSGDQLERIVAARFPDGFNATNDENGADARSDDKGPEPEAVTTGYVNGRLYAFLGLERVSGIAIFDISDPTTPMFIDYLSNRYFSAELDEETTAEFRALGDLGPEGLYFVPNEESPNGSNLLAVANEVSGTTTVWNLDEVLTGKFMLQVLHSSDNESKFQEPNTGEEKILGYSAVVDGLQQVAANADIPSVHLTAGDHTLPGPFYQASAEVEEFQHPGIADIAIYNAMDVAANGMGNHEFDGGINEFAHMLNSAAYPFVAANLDFSNVTFEDGTPAIEIGVDGASAEENAGKVVRSCYLTVGGERIGFIGRAPADFFNIIEDPENTLGGLDFFGGRGSGNQPLVSGVTHVLEQVDLLESKGINKIILIDHAQDFTADPLSAGSLRGIDIIVAAGSTGFMAQSTANGPFNLLRPGDTPEADYPTVRSDSEGETVLVVNSDQLYTYVGNLIVGFDKQGRICEIDGRSGPITTDQPGIDALSSLLGESIGPDPEVQRVWDILRETPSIQQSFAVAGTTTEELVGARAQVRSRETNLGRLAADSTLWFATGFANALNNDEDPDNDIPFAIDVALKNGGGIRSTILGPDIRRLAIEEALAFNNKLSLISLTAAELLASMENAVSRYPALDGRFPQIAGMTIVFDPENPGVQGGVSSTTPSRILSLVVHRADGSDDVVVEEGAFVGDSNRTFGLATNSFLLTGGDGYSAFRAILDDEGRPTFETDLGEQAILEQYIVSQFPDALVDLPEPLANPRVILLDLGLRYTMWVEQFTDPIGPMAAIDEDLNGDGRNNFFSYAFNSDPNLGGDANLPAVGKDSSGNPTLAFTLINDPDLNWSVEISTDGETWVDGVAGTDYAIESEDAGEGETSVVLSLFENGPSRLYRILVE